MHEALKTSPFATAATMVSKTGLTMPTVNGAFEQLLKLNIVDEVAGKRRGQVFSYREYPATLHAEKN